MGQDTKAQFYRGRELTERLIERFAADKNNTVLSRTQMFPLVFEEYLRILQYTDQDQTSLHSNARYLVYGNYRVDGQPGPERITLYLYIDLIRHGRELRILHAENWDAAYQAVEDAVSEALPLSQTQVSAEAREEARRLFLQALRTRGMAGEPILSGRAALAEPFRVRTPH